MADNVIQDTFATTYSDDYRDSDNFYKILFNNGRPLQQRELNQLQTIINEDVKGVGSATFVMAQQPLVVKFALIIEQTLSN